MKRIYQLHPLDKPREKLSARGAQALTNDELMAVLLGSGIRGKDVRQLAREIITLLDRHFAHPHQPLNLEALGNIHGLGVAKASQILAAFELARRYLMPPKRRITDASDVYEELAAFSRRAQEHFIVITLDGASHIIQTRTVFIGTLNQSLVHPREVFANAIADRAAGIIIAHNHPSGNLEPSQADRRITQRLKEAATLLGIDLLDHVILTRDGYRSFAEEGWLSL
jgi:DNA repair protein RadC